MRIALNTRNRRAHAVFCSSYCGPRQHLSWRHGLGVRFGLALRSIVIAAAVGVLGLTAVSTDAALQGKLEAAGETAELIYLPPTRFLRAMSLGYEHALADVLWFRTISYFGHHYRSDRLYPWLARMCDTVTDLDPSAVHVYRFGGLLLPWEADLIDDGIALLEKGSRNLPDSWELKYMLGFTYYFFKADLAAATQSLRTASLIPGAPEYVAHLAALVSAAHEGPSRAIDFLAELDATETSEEMHGIIRQRIQELSMTRDIDALEAAVKAFGAQFQRAPADLQELVSVGLLASIPREPFGDRYVLDASGAVRSSGGHKPRRLSSSLTREALLKRQHPEDDHGTHAGAD